MLKLKLVFQNRRGFTLIELVLGMLLISMLIITLYTCLSFTLKLNEKSIIEDEMLLNGRYILEYIKEEISSADKIISSSYFKDLNKKYPRNIGFVILKIDMGLDNKNTDKNKFNLYSYTTYYFQDDAIIRINAKRKVNKDRVFSTEKTSIIFPTANEFTGYNKIGYNILRESNISLKDDNLISLDLYLKSEKSEISNFSSDIYVRCRVVNWYEEKQTKI